ncbi:amidohydrolase family protein [Haliangium sp.]|uniref:amidohydrolase family protein n=1 Tax=Haliangium sp. TaxID=2663208 RepID=UPI003D0C137B
MRAPPIVVCASVAVYLLSGCSDDSGVSQVPDGVDAGVDAGELPSMPAPAATVVQSGTGGVLLRGVVLAPDQVIDPGEVLIVGDTIQCVAVDCSAEPNADTVTIIETGGIVSPGLIDAHNHLAYDFLPEWEPPALYMNRYEWADVADYEAHVLPYTAYRSSGSHYCPAAKWGELRALVHGTTTIQGQSFEQSCIDRLVRNADHKHGLGPDHMQTTIASPRDITDEQAMGYVDNFLAGTTTRLAVHMGEGYTGDNVEDEFGSFAGRDPRDNRHMGVSLLAAGDGAYSGTGLLIHAVALTDEELMEVAATDASVVWSPSSNLVLYGQTADIARMLELGITVGLGPDWTISGEDDMLAELRFALGFGQLEAIAALTPQRLIEMATRGSARAVGLEAYVGRLEVGYRADVAVFGRIGPDPYRAVIDSDADDVRLVLIDGQAYYGDLALEAATAVNGDCDTLDACGIDKFLCVANTPGADSRADERLEDVAQQLYDILEGTDAPPEEQYGRGDELLPLVSCE